MVINKIYDFDEVSPTSVSTFLKSVLFLQKVAPDNYLKNELSDVK